MGTWKSFEEIEGWQLARAFCKDVYRIINYDLFRKDFKLCDQLNSSSGSAMDNIAEGFERDGTKEFKQFLSIAKGSVGESRSQLYRAFDRDYIKEEEFVVLKRKAENISGKLNNLIQYLKKTDQKGSKYR
ncbi:MAG: four helix bundle protein [Bacteroidales bacterium]|nr:four helix bundle protein [Bacteroidales bacterium]